MKDPACLHKPYIRTILPWDTDKAWRTTHSSRSGISQSVSLTAKDFCSSLTESYSDWWTWPCTFSLWCLCSCCMWFPLRGEFEHHASYMHSLPQTHTLFCYRHSQVKCTFAVLYPNFHFIFHLILDCFKICFSG